MLGLGGGEVEGLGRSRAAKFVGHKIDNARAISLVLRQQVRVRRVTSGLAPPPTSRASIPAWRGEGRRLLIR